MFFYEKSLDEAIEPYSKACLSLIEASAQDNFNLSQTMAKRKEDVKTRRTLHVRLHCRM